MNDRFSVPVDADIVDLAEAFLENRGQAAKQALQAVDTQNWNMLRQIGHELKGTAGSYGFRELSAIGMDLEDAALRRDLSSAGDAVARMSRYLDRVTIVPRPRPTL